MGETRMKIIDLENNKWVNEQCDCLVINDTNYFIRCNYAFEAKVPNSDYAGIHLEILVLKQVSEDEAVVLEWKDFKGSYASEKIRDYIKNTINGQRAIYWDNAKERNFKG